VEHSADKRNGEGKYNKRRDAKRSGDKDVNFVRDRNRM
jgi:hypothetical protein